MSQSVKRSVQETMTNTALGILLSQTILLIFGLPLIKAAGITLVMIVVSIIRSYSVRRFFNWLEIKDEKKDKKEAQQKVSV